MGDMSLTACGSRSSGLLCHSCAATGNSSPRPSPLFNANVSFGCDCNRSHRRASGSPQLEWQADEGKFVALIASQFLQQEVFYEIDAMTYQQNHMTRQRYLEIGIHYSHLVPGHIVGSHCPDS